MSTTAQVLSCLQPDPITLSAERVVAAAREAGYEGYFMKTADGGRVVSLGLSGFIPVWPDGLVCVEFRPELLQNMVIFRPRFIWPDGRNQVTSYAQEHVLEAMGVHSTEQRVGETVSISLPWPVERHLLVECLSADIPELLRQAFQGMVDAVERQAGVKIHADLGNIEATLSERGAVSS